jgi:hypothetical protein
MILFPLVTALIWLQAFIASALPYRRFKEEQSRSEDGNPIQYSEQRLRHISVSISNQQVDHAQDGFERSQKLQPANIDASPLRS